MVTLASQRRLREEGEAAIIATLRMAGPLTRRELSQRANLGRTTVFKIVRDLLSRSVLVEADPNELARGRGRPTTRVSLNPRLAVVAGVELARGHARVLLVNAAHEEIGYGVEQASFLEDPNAYRRVLSLMDRVAQQSGSSLHQIKHVGLGWSGTVNPQVPSENITRLRHGLEAELGFDINIANNSHLASLAESTWGAARGHDNVLYVHWSSGIGSGWVSRGEVLRGARGMAGELGHVSIDPAHGPTCYCGGKGCLEMFAGLEALTRRAGKPAGADELGLIDAAQAEDPKALSMIQTAAAQVGWVIAMAAVLLDPDVVVLGGEASRLGETVIGPIRNRLAELVTPRVPRKIEVLQSALGEVAAVKGAVALVLPETRF